MNEKLKSAIIGGVVAGIASGLPYIGAVNTACCALYIGGGVLATYLFMKHRAASAKAPYGEGAVVGLLAGVFGGIVATIIPLFTGGYEDAAQQFLASFDMVAQQGGELPAGIREMFDTSEGVSGSLIGMFLVINVVSAAIAATVGGIVGVAVFHKKDAAAGAE
ncbi:MAG: hypothetical protein F4029_04280 [Gammaproteobacteria bacterium]|nr:hypothetical protein [Gammaproteobacteria bacterium]MYF31151.1 hypothetical protein [Gammaproteobacteria bacterium]MYK45428.1 hypothetical protein [Gammaproteobacteria bacterium]